MNFWDWISEFSEYERFGFGKRFLVGFLIFFVIPLILYSLIVLEHSRFFTRDDGGWFGLGMIIVYVLYAFGAHYNFAYNKTKKRLNKLLDMLLDENEVDHIIVTAKINRGREYEKGEDRLNWFRL
jgi:hypothetical protein